MKVTLYSLMQEISTYAIIDPEAMQKARTSKLTTQNSTELKFLLQSWKNGDYDECPECLAQELEWLAD